MKSWQRLASAKSGQLSGGRKREPPRYLYPGRSIGGDYHGPHGTAGSDPGSCREAWLKPAPAVAMGPVLEMGEPRIHGPG